MATIGYVNNKDLYEELKKFRFAYDAAVALGNPTPEIPRPVCYAIIRICNKLTNSFRFVNYPYKDEMVGDAILKCTAKIHLFDPLKSENPFAYITQIAWNSVIERIKKEQNEISIKAKMIRQSMSSEFVEHAADDEDVNNAFVTFLKENDVYVDYNEQRANKTVHPSLVHRNKTTVAKKTEEKQKKEVEPQFDLSHFEGDEE